MSGGRLSIEHWDGQPVGVLRMAGQLYLPDVPRVMAAGVSAMHGASHRVLVCDLSELSVPLNDTNFTVFPAMLRRCGGWPHASLHLAAPDPKMGEHLRLIRMHRYVPVHPSLADALSHAELDALVNPLELALRPDPGCLATARDAVRGMLPQACGVGRDDAVLVANELVANAIVHAAAPFSLAVAVSPVGALVAVTDPSRNEPIVRPARTTSFNGRGMQLVVGLSQDWGVRLVYRRGKTVWARLPAPAGPVPRSRSGAG